MNTTFFASGLTSIALLVMACGSTSQTGQTPGASDASTDAADATTPSVDGAATGCAAEDKCGDLSCDPYGDESAKAKCTKTGCAAPVDVCGTVSFLDTGSSSSSGGGPMGVYGKNGPDTEKESACALAALRDGVPGTRIRVDLGNTMGGTFLTYEIASNRRASGSESVSYDSPSSLKGLRGRTLKPSTYFADCLAKSDLNARAYCLKDAFEACK